jgi:hypothetical protein
MLRALSARTLDFSPTDAWTSGVTGLLFKIPFTGVFLIKIPLGLRQIRISFTITYGNTKQSENSGTERSKFGASKLEMLIAGFNNVGLIKSWGVDSGLGLTSCLFFKRLNVKYFKLLQNLSYIFIE